MSSDGPHLSAQLAVLTAKLTVKVTCLTFSHFPASQLRSFAFTLQFDDILSAHQEKTTSTTRVEAMTLAKRSASS